MCLWNTSMGNIQLWRVCFNVLHVRISRNEYSNTDMYTYAWWVDTRAGTTPITVDVGMWQMLLYTLINHFKKLILSPKHRGLSVSHKWCLSWTINVSVTLAGQSVCQPPNNRQARWTRAAVTTAVSIKYGDTCMGARGSRQDRSIKMQIWCNLISWK